MCPKYDYVFLLKYRSHSTLCQFRCTTQWFYLCINYEMGFPGGSVVKTLPANTEDMRDSSLIPGLGRAPGEGNGKPLQYSCLENPTDRGARWATVHSITEGRKQLSTHTHTDQNSETITLSINHLFTCKVITVLLTTFLTLFVTHCKLFVYD